MPSKPLQTKRVHLHTLLIYLKTEICGKLFPLDTFVFFWLANTQAFPLKVLLWVSNSIDWIPPDESITKKSLLGNNFFQATF